MHRPVSSSRITLGSSELLYGQRSCAPATETRGQAFSRDIEAAYILCSMNPGMRAFGRSDANSQLQTDHFHNPQYKKRSISALADQCFYEGQLLVREEEHQKKDQAPTYNAANESFSIESLLKPDRSTSQGVPGINSRHQSFESSDISTDNQDRTETFSRPSLQFAIIKPQENRAQQQDSVEITKNSSLHAKETKPIQDRRVKCTKEECSKILKNKKELNPRIKRIHNSNVGSLCEICGDFFRQHRGLIKHIKRKHLGERNCKCSICPSSFFDRHDLRRHEMTHSRQRDYSCNLCNYVSNRSGRLKRHIEIKH